MNKLKRLLFSNNIEMKSNNTVIVMSYEEYSEILQPMTNNITPMDLNNGQSQVSQNNSYRNNFDELGDPIGRGGFGTVFKVRHKWDGNVYAVKKVTFPVNGSDGRQQRVLKEAQSLAKLSPQYVVRYHYSWLEDNVLYIQMEYCPQSLRKLLADKALAFGRQSVKPMKPFEYYISCIIFKELLECVKYLHKLDPQVIHRDLKPENILISQNLRSNRCVKLCDFGLATEHNPNRLSASHTLGVGTFPYMAPEVFDDKYNPKSDIYSLGIIGKELFGIDFNFPKSFESNDPLLKSRILCMSQTLVKMMAQKRLRPQSWDVLAIHNEWAIDKTVVTTHKDFNAVLNTLKSNVNPVFYEILFWKTL